MIDVGANIGDTIISTAPEAGDRYIALEPHPFFFRYLLENTASIESIECLQLGCSEKVEHLSFRQHAKGTATPTIDGIKEPLAHTQPLDIVWQRKWHRGRVDFVKIDTDGFDASVIRSSIELLSTCQPWLYYEYDVRLTPGGRVELLDSINRIQECGYEEALVFDNFGEFVCQLRLDDASGWNQLIESQCKDGSSYYHDILIVPPGEDASIVLDEYLTRPNI